MKRNHVWIIEHLSIHESNWKPWAMVRHGNREAARRQMRIERLSYSGKFRLRKYESTGE